MTVPAVRLTDVQKSFGPTAVIMGVSLDVAAGSRHAIIGPNGAGKTLVMVEHDMGVVFDLADVVTVLVYGEVIASGPPAEIRANRAVQDAYLGAEVA